MMTSQWAPPDTGSRISGAVSQLFTKAAEDAVLKRDLTFKAARTEYASRGVADGAVLKTNERLAGEAVVAFGANAVDALLVDIYGQIPPAAAPWIRETVTTRVRAFANSMGLGLEEATKKADITSEGARRETERAASNVLRDLEIKLAPIEIRAELAQLTPAPAVTPEEISSRRHRALPASR